MACSMAVHDGGLTFERIVVPTPYAVGPANVYVIAAEPVTLVDCGPNTRIQLTVDDGGPGILTIEGVADHGKPHPLQDAFDETGGAQCGFCTPGILMSAHALLARNPSPSRAEIAHALSGNLCRCTGYTKIFEAVEIAARRLRERSTVEGAR